MSVLFKVYMMTIIYLTAYNEMYFLRSQCKITITISLYNLENYKTMMQSGKYTKLSNQPIISQKLKLSS